MTATKDDELQNREPLFSPYVQFMALHGTTFSFFFFSEFEDEDVEEDKAHGTKLVLDQALKWMTHGQNSDNAGIKVKLRQKFPPRRDNQHFLSSGDEGFA